MEEKLVGYRKRVYHFILKFVKDRQLADDLTQDVMVKVWLKRDVVFEYKSVDSYILAMSKNHVMDHFKRLAKEKTYQDEVWALMPQSEENVTSEIIHKELHTRLEEVVNELPPRQQEIYSMKYDGLSLEEISAKLGIAPNTAKNHLSRALKVIRTTMQPETLILLCMFIG
ncbi:MAG: sigma-70 family RNA polymerase sigma factor [Saprospiraceae bacterium]|nr:sigma-70 family RNA polymerase sigma factor [Saprospiraceae bacterium]